MYREKDSFRTYNYDEDMSNRTKHGMSQHETFVVPPENEYKSYRKYIEEKKAKENAKNDKENEQNEQNDENENSDKSKDNTKDVEQLKKIEFFVKATSSVARLIQLDHPGFIPNQRQYRQFGLSVLQITQSLQEHISLLYEKKVYMFVYVIVCGHGLWV